MKNNGEPITATKGITPTDSNKTFWLMSNISLYACMAMGLAVILLGQKDPNINECGRWASLMLGATTILAAADILYTNNKHKVNR